MIIDAQAHIWEVDRPDRPWPKEPRGKPQLPNGFSAEEMLTKMDATGVDRLVIVPPIWAGDNNITALEAAERHPDRFAVMGRFDPTAPASTERLRGWLAQKHMLGIRLSLGGPPFAAWLDDGTLDSFWADAERFGIPVMVLVSGHAWKMQAVAERHPGLTLIIDHMGAVLSEKGAGAFAGLDELLALAAHPKVFVKVTSAPCFSAEPYPFRDIHPFLKRIYDAFGPRRMLWGSDITRLTSTYQECLDLFDKALDFLSAEDKERILGKAASEALNWPI